MSSGLWQWRTDFFGPCGIARAREASHRRNQANRWRRHMSAAAIVEMYLRVLGRTNAPPGDSRGGSRTPERETVTRQRWGPPTQRRKRPAAANLGRFRIERNSNDDGAQSIPSEPFVKPFDGTAATAVGFGGKPAPPRTKILRFTPHQNPADTQLGYIDIEAGAGMQMRGLKLRVLVETDIAHAAERCDLLGNGKRYGILQILPRDGVHPVLPDRGTLQ